MYLSANPKGNDKQQAAFGEKRTVKTGLSDGATVEITDGLQSGDKVVYTIATDDTSTTNSLSASRNNMSKLAN